jgi:protein TonB
VFGKVIIEVLIDEDGNVVSAKVISGDSLLANAAVKAARRAKFVPTMLAGTPVKVSGNITYNFVP